MSLKSPDAVVTLPIYIGNIAVNVSPSRPVPPSPMHGGPVAAAGAVAGVTPSAPPAEDDPEEGLCAGGFTSEPIPTKSHSQQDPLGQSVTMSPSAFSHAPRVALPPGHRQPDASAPLFCVSTGATIPFFSEGNDVTPIPTSCSLILPPEYSSWDYPHGESRAGSGDQPVVSSSMTDMTMSKTREYRDQDQNDAGRSFTAAVTAVTLHPRWQPVLSYSATDVSDQGQTWPSHSDKHSLFHPMAVVAFHKQASY